jgi:hypothetical protein
MKIGIIGAGQVGVAVGRRLAAAGHELVVSFSRTSDGLADAVRLIGSGARAGSPEEAVVHGEIVLLATPWSEALALITPLAGSFDGKIVWDTTNPIAPDMTTIDPAVTTSGGELVASAVPQARVVKAVLPFVDTINDPLSATGDALAAVFVVGDDEEARSQVKSVIDTIGLDGIDAGPLRLARCTERLGVLLVYLAFARGFGPRIGPTLLRDQLTSAHKVMKRSDGELG